MFFFNVKFQDKFTAIEITQGYSTARDELVTVSLDTALFGNPVISMSEQGSPHFLQPVMKIQSHPDFLTKS